MPSAAASRRRSSGRSAALTASLSGILLAHGVLDARQRDAADRFRRARAAVFGRILPGRDLSRREATEDPVRRNE